MEAEDVYKDGQFYVGNKQLLSEMPRRKEVV
jgi:hypothetical protein